MPEETFIVMLPPRQLPELQGWQVTPAHQAYRLGPRLLRAEGAVLPRGGLMVLGDRGFDPLGGTAALTQDILRECQARGFQGAVLDFDSLLPPLEQLAVHLEGEFSRRGWTLYVPERYAHRISRGRVMISSALSGGSLRQRLEEAVERLGKERVALALERVAEDFFLPSPTGSGQPLTQAELSERMAQLHPSVFFSADLCARYFTYMSRESGAHFVLFDDGDTLCRKAEVARELGIHTILASWQDAGPHMAQLGVRRSAQPNRAPQGGGNRRPHFSSGPS